jgi:hypothetical protein
MAKKPQISTSELATQQGAVALLTATLAFLIRNRVSRKFIMKSAHLQLNRPRTRAEVGEYKKLIRAYEEMGLVMSTWFSLPKFLDREGRPLPLSSTHGPQSIPSLVRSARVKIRATLAIELMRQSRSVHIDSQGNYVAIKRFFVLPEFEVPRAALVIERYLDTLRRNSSAHRKGTTLLLERNCHVPEIGLTRIAPMLRDIKSRGTAFMDSVDGDIEAHRIHKSRKSGVGELGVLVFAWTRPARIRRQISIKQKFERKPGD